ncbi:hypothetical protein [Poriferisphaera sp. WC338]|uniref:hypothetical protein n=1 Tax=Poriferisphaera sp. WC338 TaxID=3425129 RepID=UPI003D81B59C
MTVDENHDFERVTPALAAVEFNATAEVCKHFASHPDASEVNLLERRIFHLRKAVIASAGRRQIVPAEILYFEYQANITTVEHHQSFREELLEYVDTDRLCKITLERPQQFRKSGLHRYANSDEDQLSTMVDLLSANRSSATSIAKRMTEKRLFLNSKTAQGLLRKYRTENKRLENWPLTNLIVGSIYDHLPYREDRKVAEQIGKLINTMTEHGYPPLLNYYLIQTFQTLPLLEPNPHWQPKKHSNIEQLIAYIRKGNSKNGEI